MMMTDPTIPPGLEPRFCQPENWRWHVFTNARGQKLRFGAVSPKGRIPDAVVVCLPGLSEFGEKYFELAHDMLARNMAFWVLDWQGQGKSQRPPGNPHKRHVASFDDDVADLDFFLNEYVKHAAVHPDVGRLPMVMLAHSMGGNIGLRYIARYPDMFSCAAFSAPMTGIRALRHIPLTLALALSGLLRGALNRVYVFGGGDWSADERADPARNIFSGDPARNALHNAWCIADPALRVGGVTFGWVFAALRSCAVLRRQKTAAAIDIPCLFGLASDDALVDNKATRNLAARLKQAHILELPGARHEILMESDPIRRAFLENFFILLDENRIREKLKTF